MIRISPFTPLFFSPSKDSCGVASSGKQIFAPTDMILIQIVCDTSDPSPELVIQSSDGGRGTVDGNRWEINESTSIITYRLVNLDEGEHTVELCGKRSEPFTVTANTEDTVLIQYSMKDNRRRSDCAFWIAGIQQFFDFRVPGGFKDNDWIFGVDSEQFLTSDMDPIDLFARESLSKTLTIGGPEGCPIWIGEHINRLLCCNYVYIDGVRYARKGQSVPEAHILIEGTRSYVFTQQVQPVTHLEPLIENQNQIRIRRSEAKYRIANNKPLIL